jgi:ADP-heptose:LPS heptosyltransferase
LTHALIVRMDRLGEVTYLASPAGAPAARLLPGVNRVVVDRAGWIDDPPLPVTRASIDALVERVVRLRVDTAVVLTSFHQSPLPMAMVARMAGVGRIGAISVDYPGSLLDVRHLVDDDVHEVVRALSLGEAMGYRLPAGDDGCLQVAGDTAELRYSPALARLADRGYVVVHPGASVTARSWPAGRYAETVDKLVANGWPVVVTGGPGEQGLTAVVAGRRGVDVGGRLDVAGLARVMAGAAAVVVGNTGPAHLAAAVGTPVVSLYAPTVPAVRWRPWMVPHVLLGDQDIECAGCRARQCPVPGHPCLEGVDPDEVVGAVLVLASPAILMPLRRRTPDGPTNATPIEVPSA